MNSSIAPRNPGIHAGEDVKEIVICADDFGLHPEVDRAIVDLTSRGRIGATSVLVDASGVQERAGWIVDQPVDIGLHLNMTEQVGDLDHGDVKSLARLVLQCYTGRISSPWIECMIERQLTRYEERFGKPPDYVDGHQHVHQLPVIRDVLLQKLQQRYGLVKPWIRSTVAVKDLWSTGWQQWFKAKVIESLGAKALQRSAHSFGYRTNNGFAGVYDFTRPAQPFEKLLTDWVKASVEGSVIMTHPSAAVLADDPVGQARLTEYQVLSSDWFTQMLLQHGRSLARLSQISSRP